MNQATQDQMFNFSKYFINRDGLYIWADFARWILLAYQQPIPRRGIKDVDHVHLKRNMYDHEIVAEYLGGEEEARKHALTLDQVADLIDAQWGGKSGVLLNNGHANLLFMLGKDGVLFPVDVSWSSDGSSSSWGVRARQFGRVRWGAGRRVIRNKH